MVNDCEVEYIVSRRVTQLREVTESSTPLEGTEPWLAESMLLPGLDRT